MSSKLMQQDTTSRQNMQPAEGPWQPFPELEWVRGGISLKSDGPMSWNGNSPEEVIRNRLRFLERTGLDARLAVGADQVHGKEIYRVKAADAGRGILDRDGRIKGTDGLITDERGLILTTLHADCAPVFYADPEHYAIGLAHAGRRGILAGVAGDMLRQMKAEFRSDPRAVRVTIGPTICTTCYGVDRDVAGPFAARFGQQVVVWEGDTPHLDLVAALIVDLLEAGLNPSFIPARPPCTATNTEFASYRRDGMPVRSMISWLCTL